jgi:MFS family permease
MLLQTAGLVLFSGIAVRGHYYSDILAGSLLIALGIGFAFVTGSIAAVSGVAPQEAGLASGLVNTSRMFGGALGLAILATIATSHTNTLLHKHTAPHAALTGGFHVAFAVAAGIGFVGALVAAFALPRVRVRRPAAPAEAHAPQPEVAA